MGRQSARRRTTRIRRFRLGKPAPAQLRVVRLQRLQWRPAGVSAGREAAAVLGPAAVPTAPTRTAGAQVGALAGGSGSVLQ